MDSTYWMYLSLWNEHGGAPGLVQLEADSVTGDAKVIAQPDDKTSFGCSFVDRRRGILYVCNEAEQVWGVSCETGRIYAYKISSEDGSLSELFYYDTFCPNPSYVTEDPSGRYLIVAHHSKGGAIAKINEVAPGEFLPRLINREAPLIVYALEEDGSIGPIMDVKKHPVAPDSRPYGSFLHCCVFSPDGRFLAVCDKGDGQLYLYAFDNKTGRLTLCDRMRTDVPGSHPRYCVFHPTKPYIIVNHEQEREHRMMVASFRYNNSGKLEKLSSVNLLSDEDVVPERSHYEQQGIAVSENGSHVYTCVNGLNQVGVIAVDDSGMLSLEQRVSIPGEWPRGLALMPGGKVLFATCLVSGDVFSYPVGEDGRLGEPRLVTVQRGGTYISFYK